MRKQLYGDSVKKNLMKLFLNHFFVSTITAFVLTSCVNVDMYDLYDDGNEMGFICRKKMSKDNMNYMNKLGKDYPPHVLCYFEPTGCIRRSLQAKYGSNWVSQTANAINAALNYAEEHGNEEFYMHLLNRYYTNGEIDEDKISTYFNTTSVLFHFGFSQQSNVAVGDIVLTYTFDKWGAEKGNLRHSSYVTAKDDGSRMYADSDGNQWSYDFIEYIFR